MRKYITHILSFINKPSILYPIIFILGFITRLYRIDYPIADWHSWRQSDTASVTRIYVDEGIKPFYPRYYDISTTQSGIFNPEGFRFVEFPVYNIIHAILTKYFGIFSLEVWGRLLTIGTTIITAYYLFILGDLIIGKGKGIIASFVFLFAPYNIFFSRVILPDQLACLFGVLGFLYFLKSDNGRITNKFLISSIFYSIGMLTKPYIGFYLFPVVILLIKDGGVKIMVKSLKNIIFASIVILPFLLWRFWESRFPEGIPFWKWAFNGDGIRFKPAFWYWIFGERIGKMILGVWGAIFFVLGLLPVKKINLKLLSLLLSALTYISLVATANVKHDYYQILIMPIVALTCAQGMNYFFETYQMQPRIKWGFAAAIFFLSFLISAFQVKGFYNVNRWEIIEAGKRIDEITPTDVLVIAPYNGDTAFLYQTKRFGWPVVDRPLPELIAKGADYFVSVDLNHWQTLDFQKEYQTVEKNDRYIILDLNQKI